METVRSSRVFARWSGDGNLYPATIIRSAEDGACLVDWIFEAEPEWVAAKHMRPLTVILGSCYDCRPDDADDYLPCHLIKVADDDVKIEFAGREPQWVTINELRISVDNDDGDEGEDGVTGMRVFAPCGDDGYLYPGTVTKYDEDDDLLKIEFDAGWEAGDETVWAPRLQTLSAELEVGDECEVYLEEREEYAACSIVKCDGDDVKVCMDGDSAFWTTNSYLRIWADQESAGDDDLGVDARVFARRMNLDGNMYPATVLKCENERILVDWDSDSSPEWTEKEAVIRIPIEDGQCCQWYDDDSEAYEACKVLESSGENVRIMLPDESELEAVYSDLRFSIDTDSSADVDNAFDVNDRVFATRESYGGGMYPATVLEVDDGRYRVDWDDESDAVWLDASELMPLQVECGEYYECYREDEDDYQACAIVDVDGEDIKVVYEDAAEEWVTTSNLRVQFE